MGIRWCLKIIFFKMSRKLIQIDDCDCKSKFEFDHPFSGGSHMHEKTHYGWSWGPCVHSGSCAPYRWQIKGSYQFDLYPILQIPCLPASLCCFLRNTALGSTQAGKNRCQRTGTACWAPCVHSDSCGPYRWHIEDSYQFDPIWYY